MLDEITANKDLFGILRQSCEENAIGVRFCDGLMENGLLREDSIRILKVDAWYSSKRTDNPPPAIDCLIVVRTGEQEFGLTLVELKNVSGAKRLKPREIRPKFDTAIHDFLSDRFANIFLNTEYGIAHLRLWLVTNPHRLPPMPEAQYRRRMEGLALKLDLSTNKPCKFRGKLARIEPKPPDSEVCI